MTSTRVAAVGALCAVALSSCSGSGGEHAVPPAATISTTTTTSVADAQPGLHNADDIAFAYRMRTHDEQAVQLSTIVPTNTTNEQLVALAQQITAEEQPQIQAFTAWLLQWGADPNADPDAGPGGIPGMVDQATLARLQTLNGPGFDKLWLQSMVSNRLGGIDMAQAEVARGQNPDAIAMARSTITTQQTEIDRMKQVLGG